MLDARLHAVIDACHSGTALDLPWTAEISKSGGMPGWTYNYPNGT